jgi:hypothetical protein
MASRERAIVNNLNERARFYGQADELTIYDVRALLHCYEHTCLKCGIRPATSFDHVKPLGKGGLNILENGQLLCVKCQKEKGDEEIDYREGKVASLDSSYESDEMETSENNYDYVNEGNEVESRPNYYPARSRTGRKPLAATILRRRLVEDKVDEAEASFAYLCAVRDNPFEPSAQRLAAAEMILDRVLGKATETSKQQKEIVITVIREQRESIGAFARLALGSGTD